MRPIEEARSADLKGSLAALRRAAQRARVLAAQTGAKLIVRRDGASEPGEPKPDRTSKVQEGSKPYGI